MTKKANAVIQVLMVAVPCDVRDRHLSAIQPRDDVEVVGTAADIPSGFTSAESHRPDVIVLGEATTREACVAHIPVLRSAGRRAAVIVLGAAIDLPHVERCVNAGARGYVLDDAPTDLVAAIRSATPGGIWLSPRVAAELIRHERRRLGDLAAREKLAICSPL
jgi:DNA-binding NarL/FixJ family response regulator